MEVADDYHARAIAAWANAKKVGERLQGTMWEVQGPSGSERNDLSNLLANPNPRDDWHRFMNRIGQQISLTGMGLVWMVPNQFGKPFELYVIPTVCAIPQPTINPEFPDGYFRIQPLYSYGETELPEHFKVPFAIQGSAIIPVKWMVQLDSADPNAIAGVLTERVAKWFDNDLKIHIREKQS